MIYLYKVTGKEVSIRHTGVTQDFRIHVAVLDESYDENVLMSLVLPEFVLTYNRLDQYDCYVYLNFIIEKYRPILLNLKEDKNINKFMKKGDKFIYGQGLTSMDEYYKLLRSKANVIIRSYEDESISTFNKFLNAIKNKILKRFE